MSYTKKFSLVAAIDFGTKYSRFAFSFRHQYDLDPSNVNVHNWSVGDEGRMSPKCPTCVLFDPSKNFHSFGYEAENKYADLAMDHQHQNWYLFRRFKMTLYDAMTLKRDFLLDDETGKQMSAMTVFAAVFKSVKIKLYKEKTPDVTESDIGWVITVPGTWTDASKQFMREAAEQAGIPGSNLMLALEPEAASLFYIRPPVDKSGGVKSKALEKGSKYMIIDAGAGTVDIIVHEVMDYPYVKEIFKANGGPWGGTKVNDEFCSLLSDVVGKDCFHSFMKTERYDYLELMREFEQKKHKIKSDDSKMQVRIPPSLNDACKKANGGMSMNDMIQKRQLENKLVIIENEITLSSACVLQLFTSTTAKITDHIQSLLMDLNVKAISTIVMVGAFSECEVLKTKIRQTFPEMNIVIPEKASLAVIKGAVMFGHNSSSIKERIMRFSYGTGKTINPAEHAESKDIFLKIVEIGQSVETEMFLKIESYDTDKIKEKPTDINIYASIDRNPTYVTEESCIRLGEIGIDLSGIPYIRKTVTLAMTFSGTEHQVKATTENGEKVKSYFNYLQ